MVYFGGGGLANLGTLYIVLLYLSICVSIYLSICIYMYSNKPILVLCLFAISLVLF